MRTGYTLSVLKHGGYSLRYMVKKDCPLCGGRERYEDTHLSTQAKMKGRYLSQVFLFMVCRSLGSLRNPVEERGGS